MSTIDVCSHNLLQGCRDVDSGAATVPNDVHAFELRFSECDRVNVADVVGGTFDGYSFLVTGKREVRRVSECDVVRVETFAKINLLSVKRNYTQQEKSK